MNTRQPQSYLRHLAFTVSIAGDTVNFVYSTGKRREYSSSLLAPLQGMAAFSWFPDGVQTQNAEDFSLLKRAVLCFWVPLRVFPFMGDFFACCGFFNSLIQSDQTVNIFLHLPADMNIQLLIPYAFFFMYWKLSCNALKLITTSTHIL